MPHTSTTPSNDSVRLPWLSDNNRLHRTLDPHRRPAPQRRRRALPKTLVQNPAGCLQPVADIPPPQPIRLQLVQDVDDDLAGPEGFRIRKAHIGARPAAEGVGRCDCFVCEQHCDGDEAVGVAGFEEGGGAGVARLDEAVCYCGEGGCVWGGRRGEVERGQGGGEELRGEELEWSRGG